MSISLPILLASLLACGSSEPEDLSRTPDGRLCNRAYSSTIDSLTDLFTKSGKPTPEWPAKDAYIEKCVALDLSEDQLKCLDPKISGSDPAGCKETLDPVEGTKKELAKWFSGELEKAMKTGDKKEGEGEEKGD